MTTPQSPFVISGTVTLNGSNYHGAQVWVRDMTEGTISEPVEDVTYIYTNSQGQYIIDMANNTSAYADGDTVRVFCKIGDMILWHDVTLNLTEGALTRNFAFTRKSGLSDGLKGSPLSTQKGGLTSSNTFKGLKDGLQ